MPTPHKHAAVIKAWADGHTVQLKVLGKWTDLEVDGPYAWGEHHEYRVKPDHIKYRNFLWCSACAGRPVVSVVELVENDHAPREQWQGFIRWIGDWQEVEV